MAADEFCVPAIQRSAGPGVHGVAIEVAKEVPPRNAAAVAYRSFGSLRNAIETMGVKIASKPLCAPGPVTNSEYPRHVTVKCCLDARGAVCRMPGSGVFCRRGRTYNSIPS